MGRYTGLTDENGMKIFEGDILASRYDKDHPEDVTIEAVVWAYNGWSAKATDDDLAPLVEDDALPCSEVIGNIHDDPGLLEGEAK